MPTIPLPALCISSRTDESIDGAQAQHVAQRSIFPFGRRDPTLAQNLHAHNSLARVVHLLEDRGDFVGFAVVHDQPFRIDPGQINFHKRSLGGGAQRIHAMAARPVGTDDLVLLGLYQVLHGPLVLGRPALFCHAVEQKDVDVVDTQLHAIALEMASRVGDVGRMGLGLDDVLLARNALESFAKVRVRPVLIGDVEEADPLVERVADDLGESRHAQAGLVAGLSRAHAAGSHPHERDLDAGLAQGDLLGRALGKAVLGAARARSPWRWRPLRPARRWPSPAQGIHGDSGGGSRGWSPRCLKSVEDEDVKADRVRF